MSGAGVALLICQGGSGGPFPLRDLQLCLASAAMSAVLKLEHSCEFDTAVALLKLVTPAGELLLGCGSELPGDLVKLAARASSSFKTKARGVNTRWSSCEDSHTLDMLGDHHCELWSSKHQLEYSMVSFCFEPLHPSSTFGFRRK